MESIYQCIINVNFKANTYVSTLQIKVYRMALAFQKPSLTPKSWLYLFPAFLYHFIAQICFPCFLTLLKWIHHTYIFLLSIFCEINVYCYENLYFTHFHCCIVFCVIQHSSLVHLLLMEVWVVTSFRLLLLQTCFYMFFGVHVSSSLSYVSRSDTIRS